MLSTQSAIMNQEDDMLPASPDLEDERIVYEDTETLQSMLRCLNTMRKNRQFCDVILQVGSCEIPAHRAVLASVSPYFFSLFTKDDDSVTSEFCGASNRTSGPEFRYKLSGCFERDVFEAIVNYAYTARLVMSGNQVRTVYKIASHLKIERLKKACGDFLLQQLNSHNCIGIRSAMAQSADPEQLAAVDAYMQQNMKGVLESKELHKLSRIQVEVVRNSRDEMEVINAQQLCHLILDWIQHQCDEDDLDVLSQKVYMLYLNSDNTLHDCNDIQTGDAHDSEMVQDYKRISKNYQAPNGRGRKKPGQTPSRPRQLLYSRSTSDSSLASNDGSGNSDQQSQLLAWTVTGDYNYMAVVAVAEKLRLLSICQRLNTGANQPPSLPPPLVTPRSPKLATVAANGSHLSDEECSVPTYRVIPNMGSAKCAVGTTELNGKLLVCGGYDRGECLKSVQLYDPDTNSWDNLPNMKRPRGRFGVAATGGHIIAVGGCDGSQELAFVECYNPQTGKWTHLPPLPLARSHTGVCTLNDKVYCVGGWNGTRGTKRCDAFDPASGEWTEIAKLKSGRYQCALCAYGGYLYAVGGCDSWDCLNSVERYDPATDTWCPIAPMHTARRGCGAAFYNRKLYAIGGSDGTHSLCSVEIYDPATDSWSPGPKLTANRANVGVTVVAGKLYAVGGFTGKNFLKSIEYLDPETNEWTTHMACKHTQSYSSDVSDTGSEGGSSGVDKIPNFIDNPFELLQKQLLLTNGIEELEKKNTTCANGNHSAEEDEVLTNGIDHPEIGLFS